LRPAQNIITDASFFVRRMNREGKGGERYLEGVYVADKALMGPVMAQICRILESNFDKF